MSIKNELIKRLDDHGYKLNDEGNIVIKFSKLNGNKPMTVEKFILEIDENYIEGYRKDIIGDRQDLLVSTFRSFLSITDDGLHEIADCFDPENISKVMELLKLTHDILDEIMPKNNIPERYPTQSNKDIIERELKDGGWVESEGIFDFEVFYFEVHDEGLEITSDHKKMIISYDDLVQNVSQCIDDISLSFDMPQSDFSTFINDLASIIKEMSIKTQSQNEIPKRYQTQSGKNFIDVLRNEMMSHERFLGFLEGNVYKYVFRYRNKGGKKNLRKAKHYLDLLEAEIDE